MLTTAHSMFKKTEYSESSSLAAFLRWNTDNCSSGAFKPCGQVVKCEWSGDMSLNIDDMVQAKRAGLMSRERIVTPMDWTIISVQAAEALPNRFREGISGIREVAGYVRSKGLAHVRDVLI